MADMKYRVPTENESLDAQSWLDKHFPKEPEGADEDELFRVTAVALATALGWKNLHVEDAPVAPTASDDLESACAFLDLVGHGTQWTLHNPSRDPWQGDKSLPVAEMIIARATAFGWKPRMSTRLPVMRTCSQCIDCIDERCEQFEPPRPVEPHSAPPFWCPLRSRG